MTNPFKILPFIIAAQITLGVILGGAPTEFRGAVDTDRPDEGRPEYHVNQTSTDLSNVSFPESNTSIQVEVADTPQEREKGLMHREELAENRGMLFVFPEEDRRGFWMKNTLIPLDMMFIDSNGKILNIEKAYPEPNTSDEDLKTYRSDGEAKYVIEVNLNFTDRKGIEKGDRVVIPTRY